MKSVVGYATVESKKENFIPKASSLGDKAGSEPFPRKAWRSVRREPTDDAKKEKTLSPRHRALGIKRGQNPFHAERGGQFDAV